MDKRSKIIFRRGLRGVLSLLVVGLMGVNSQAQSEEKTPIDTLAELKVLQSRVRLVVESCSPATVGLLVPEMGSSGSGVIVSSEGLILTAAHVVDGAEELVVILPTGEQARGKVLGLDRTRDEGMVQIIDKKDWPAVSVAKAGDPKVGEWVVALGHPGGYDPVRTPPVRLGRVMSHNASGFITTDCKLIGGDSGGPLFNLKGELVGIHSSIGSQKSTNNHAGIEAFRNQWESLLKGERVGRYGENSFSHPDAPILGVTFDPRERGEGIKVLEVVPNGPAAKAGIQAGDVIVEMDKGAVLNATDLATVLSRTKAGEKVNLVIERGEQKRDQEVVLKSRVEVLGK